MDIVIDTLLIILAILALFVLNFFGYVIVSQKIVTLNAKITRTLWLLSSALVTLAPFLIPLQIGTPEQLRDLRFGFPAYFVEQHALPSGANQAFPFYITLANGLGYSLRTSISINPLSYLVDVFICYLICRFILQMLGKTTLKTDAVG